MLPFFIIKTLAQGMVGRTYMFFKNITFPHICRMHCEFAWQTIMHNRYVVTPFIIAIGLLTHTLYHKISHCVKSTSFAHSHAVYVADLSRKVRIYAVTIKGNSIGIETVQQSDPICIYI